jgi:flagellar FliJ protein
MRMRNSLLRLQRFRFEDRKRQLAAIEAMINDFQRKQEDLDQQIQLEEQRNGVTDPSHFNYSMTAKSLRVRRDNLLRSAAELRDQLEDVRARFEEDSAELKRLELLAEKEAALAAPVAAAPVLADARST